MIFLMSFDVSYCLDQLFTLNLEEGKNIVLEDWSIFSIFLTCLFYLIIMGWGVYVKCNDIFIGSRDSYGYYLEEVPEDD